MTKINNSGTRNSSDKSTEQNETLSMIPLSSGGLLNSAYLTHIKNHFLNQENESDFLKYCGMPLRKSIRFNSRKISEDGFLAIAAGYGWKLTPIPWCKEGFWVDLSEANHEAALGNLAEHIQGVFYIQEASSMLPPVVLLRGNEVTEPIVADFAAAPGSKTTQLSAMLGNQGVVLANELSASRLKGLHHNLVRCGVTNVCISHHDARNIGEYMPEQFDYVLLDAPCGGEGTVRKDTQALKDWHIDKVNALSDLQQQLILSAYKALKPGGRLVYSTCTLSPEENQNVASYLLEQTNAEVETLSNLFDGALKVVTEEGYLLVLPHIFDSEGFFIASFKKPEQSNQITSLKPIFKSPFTRLTKPIFQQVTSHFKQHFGVVFTDDEYVFLQKDKEIWLFPKVIDKVNTLIKVNRAGIKVANFFPKKIRVTHEFACCFGERVTSQTVAIDEMQATAFYRGQNIEIDLNSQGDLKDGEVLLVYQGLPLGIGLNKKGKVKNSLPRELVRDNANFKKHAAQ